MAGRVVVVGSINVDLVVESDRLPLPGETVLGGRFRQHHGGKGANVAVAAARLGASVRLIGAVGDDAHGDLALEALAAESIEIADVARHSSPTGVALITVGPRGENQIAVAPGANAELAPEHLRLDDLRPQDVLVATFETPMRTVEAAVQVGRSRGARVVVDPAPAHALPTSLLGRELILTPNEHELTVAIGNDDPGEALEELLDRHAGTVVVTQGAAGALLATRDRQRRFGGFSAGPVADTTGAGDTFNGALAAFLAEGRALDEAIQLANAAAAISVTRRGARDGMPPRDAVLELAARG